MEQRPPIWLIALLVLQTLIALALLVLGVNVAESLLGMRRITVLNILAMSVPLLVVLGMGGLAWWLWMSGKRVLGGLIACLPFVPVLLLLILFGLGL